jgi:hypothetical protein
VSLAVTLGFVLLENGPGRDFLGSTAITAGTLGALLDVLVLALFFCTHTPHMFFPWHVFLLQVVAWADHKCRRPLLTIPDTPYAAKEMEVHGKITNSFDSRQQKYSPGRCMEPELENLRDSLAKSVKGQVGDRMQIKLAHDVGAVGFSRLYAEIQGDSHFLAGFPLRQKLHHFPLAGG